MFSAERMKKVGILAVERDVDRLIMGLGELGAVHLTPAREEEAGLALSPSDRRAELAKLTGLSTRLERLATVLKVTLSAEPPAKPEPFASPDEVAAFLDSVEPDVDEAVRRQQALSEEASDLERVARQVEAFAGTGFLPSRMGEYSFVHFALGTLPTKKLETLGAELPAGTILVPVGAEGKGEQTRVLALTARSASESLAMTLERHGFKAEEIQPTPAETPDKAAEHSKKRLAEIVVEDRQLADKLSALGAKRAADINRFWRQTQILQKIARAYDSFGRTASTCFLAGWVPAVRVERTVAEVMRLTEGRAVIQIRDPKDLSAADEPPTWLRHSWLTRPFALLVTGYGIPRYREVEPTIIVAITFFLMYGAMFGDVGQGSVLVLSGLAMWRWMKAGTMKDFGLLVVYCGISSILFGFAYGAFFGSESVLPALWGRPMEKVEILLGVSVIVGMGLISLGVVLNVLNKARSGDWAAALFARFGIAGLAFYWGALGLAAKFFIGGEVSGTLAVALLVTPLALIFLQSPVRHVLEAGRAKHAAHAPEEDASHPRGLAGFLFAVVEGGLEVFEALLTYVSNTASFVRIGAYTVAHAALCMVIFTFSELLGHLPAGGLWAILMIIAGNVIVILLEGVVAGIQVLRLEYYEFFGKFLAGDGKAYRPFDLKSEES